MNSNYKKKRFWSDACTYVVFIAGTTVKNCMALSHSLLNRAGVDPNMFIKCISFDSQACPPSDFCALLESDVNKIFTPANTVIAKIPKDKESLEIAEQMGITCYQPEGWSNNPTVTMDNEGASANPNKGLTITLFNEKFLLSKITKIIQEAIDHHHHTILVLEGFNPNWTNARLVCQFTCSTVGGTGNGAAYWALNDALKACAKRDGVEAKIVMKINCRGNLPTHDNTQADRNEFTLLKYINVTDTGMFVESASGIILPRLSDLTIVSSNQNNHGNITDPNKFFALEAHTDFIFKHTPAGKKIRERLNDIEEPEPDDYGDPRAAITMSSAMISRDSYRAIYYPTNKASAIFAERLTAQGNINEVRKYTVGLARVYGLFETEQDSQITSALIRPKDLEGESIFQRVRESLKDRTAASRGINGAAAISDVITSFLNNDIPATYAPMIKKQALANRREIEQNIEKNLDLCMRNIHGFWQAQNILLILKFVLENSSKEIMAKINNLRDLFQHHEHVLAETSEHLRIIQEGNLLTRGLNFLTVSFMIQNLESSGLSACDYQLQISACTIAVQDFITPLMNYIDHKLSWILMQNQKFEQIAQLCRNKAKSIAEKPITLDVPNGIELASEENLQNFFSDFLSQRGGKENLADYILNSFLAQHNSLSILTDISVEETMELFNNVCEQIFRPQVEAIDVIDELMRLYSDNSMRQRIFEQLILSSEGRFLTTGELDSNIIWIKAINLPSKKHIEWVREMSESVDKKPGKWEIAVYPDPDKMHIIQLRNNVSIARHLKRLISIDDPKTWPKIISRAPEPISTLIVNPNPTPREFRRVLAKAIVNNQLTVNDKDHFSLMCPYGERLELGSTFETVDSILQTKWPYLVFIESSFGRNIVVDDEQVFSKLNLIKKQFIEKTTSSDIRLSLIDLTAVEECLIQADLFTPWARRMRKANLRRLTQ